LRGTAGTSSGGTRLRLQQLVFSPDSPGSIELRRRWDCSFQLLIQIFGTNQKITWNSWEKKVNVAGGPRPQARFAITEDCRSRAALRRVLPCACGTASWSCCSAVGLDSGSRRCRTAIRSSPTSDFSGARPIPPGGMEIRETRGCLDGDGEKVALEQQNSQ
jgi:hypothetical protein